MIIEVKRFGCYLNRSDIKDKILEALLALPDGQDKKENVIFDFKGVELCLVGAVEELFQAAAKKHQDFLVKGIENEGVQSAVEFMLEDFTDTHQRR